MSSVIMKPLPFRNSYGLRPSGTARKASISFGINTKPSFRGAPQYLRFLTTTGSSVMPGKRLRTTSPPLPPSSFATARSLPPFQSIGKSLPTVNDFQFAGYNGLRIAVIASRCSLVTDGSNTTTAHSISPFEKSPPKSPATQNFAPASFTSFQCPLLTLKALLNLQKCSPPL